MSDLTGGGPSSAAGNGRIGSNGASRMQQGAPAPIGSPSGRMRYPTEILRDRTERARMKAEREAAEQAERARAEEEAGLEARLEDQNRRRRAERRAAAAGVAEGRPFGGEDYAAGSTQATGQRTSDNSQKSDRLSGGNAGGERPQDAPIQGRGRGGNAIGGGEAVSGASARVRGPTVSQGQPRPVPNAQNSQGPVASQTQAGPSTLPASAQAAQESSGESAGPQNTTRRTTQSSFPHAFERWETLSSHWEGLTSFWVRRLQENANEIERDPVSMQLSRQVTDLSAAGANLFHAVVELQRLRASSERKFQRWFFETRTEQERTQEMQAMLEAALQEERRGRAEAVADAVAKERERSNSDRLVAEMKREMQISKEEARRAWEELGRREQEERERTNSLRQGNPTVVGGLQVLPMTAGGAPSRNASVTNRPRTQEGVYASSPEVIVAVDAPVASYQPTSRAQRDADPFGEDSRTSAPSSSLGRADASSQQPTGNSKSGIPQYSRAPAVQPPTTSATFYQQRHGTNLLPTDDQRSEGTYSDTEYDIDPSGQIRRDSRGNKIRYSDPHSDDGSDEMDVAAERERELAHLRQYGHAPASGASYVPGTSSAPAAGPSSRPEARYDGGQEPVDYSGQGYGPDPWVSFPRHHHPTRLSDVIEEDERSRTSASQVSRQ